MGCVWGGVSGLCSLGAPIGSTYCICKLEPRCIVCHVKSVVLRIAVLVRFIKYIFKSNLKVTRTN